MHARSLLRSLLAAAALALGVFAGPSPALAVPDPAPLVYIDAGHGGPYSNANDNGLSEKTINLMISLELQRQLQVLGYRTGIDRTTDVAVGTRDIPTWHTSGSLPSLYADGTTRYSSGVPFDDLQARCNLANRAGADIFVSVHCNGVDSSGPNGTETFAPTVDPLGQRLSQLVQEEVVAEVGTVDRGAKRTDFYVIKWANMPSILIEAGFISNPAEALRLGSPIWRMRFARGVARGIDRFLSSGPFTAVYPRFSGGNRYETAAKVSQAGWPKGTSTVMLASGVNWPDAVAASPLARKLDAPILLTAPEALPEATRAEIARLRPSQIVVLGSEAAVSATATAEATAAAAPGAVGRRIGGSDRFETAALIAGEVGVQADGRVAFVSGRNFVDAVSLAPFAGRWRTPVLLVDGPVLPAATRAFVDAHRSGIRGVFVVGGEPAVPASTLKGLPLAKRVSGPDRWTTNVAMLKEWGAGTLNPLVASGADFPDGLVAGAYGAKTYRPLMLVAPHQLPDRGREFVVRTAGRISGFQVVGSANAIPYVMDWELDKALD